ncbi:RNA polymerase sigma factor [Subtercola sp. YIM 133946]|uniref:RNA polymerase sigma factor n=1 Tax=Subtercola sp. YIM 133946 TaxID=3118909 RepID=UPI002F93C79A
MSTDAEIIERSLTAPAAFGQLYERHARAVHRYASRRVGPDAADDVMSETFLVAFDRRRRFDPVWADARPWLLGIATNLLKAHRRVEARLWNATLAEAARDVVDGGEHPVGRSDDRMDAARAVEALVPALTRMRAGDRDALLLHAWGDLDYAQIAQALGVPIGTVRSRLNRARLQLRTAAPSDISTKSGREPWMS